MNITGQFCIIDGELTTVNAFCEANIINQHSIYEVIRIYNKKGAFVDEHLVRMVRSAALIGISMPKMVVIQRGIRRLIEENNIENGNIEIVVNNNETWSIRFISHSYPTDEQYRRGVKTLLYNAVREKPNAKVKRINLRKSASAFIQQKNVFEVIYVHDNQLTEGSRSNIFFIKDRQLYTPPVSDVLPGITREVIINIALANAIIVHEITISISELSQFDAAFLTGTSPEILPIFSVDSNQFDVNNNILRLLMNQFSQKIAE